MLATTTALTAMIAIRMIAFTGNVLFGIFAGVGARICVGIRMTIWVPHLWQNLAFS